MRYNEKELQALSRQPAEMAAELGMRGPKKGSGERSGTPERAGGRLKGREWAGAELARSRLVLAVVKRRLVKLVVNFLFYFRTDEAEVGCWGGLQWGLRSEFGVGGWAGSRSGVGAGRAWESGAGQGAGGFPGSLPHEPVCPQPIGALLLEHCRVTQEEPSGFSISECGLGRGWLSPPHPPAWPHLSP